MDSRPPLKPLHHVCLLLLAREPTYGVRLMERLEEHSGGTLRLNAGSLYRMIATLVEEGLIESVPGEEPSGGVGAPRKVYAVTSQGRDALRREADRQAGLLELARSLDLAEGES